MVDELHKPRRRYESHVSDDGFIEIYDTRNAFAWIRSDVVVDLGRIA